DVVANSRWRGWSVAPLSYPLETMLSARVVRCRPPWPFDDRGCPTDATIPAETLASAGARRRRAGGSTGPAVGTACRGAGSPALEPHLSAAPRRPRRTAAGAPQRCLSAALWRPPRR